MSSGAGRTALALFGAAVALSAQTASASPRSAIVRAGPARFEVLTPTLIRMEYAADGRFENAATLTATRGRLPVPTFRATVTAGSVVIRTSRIALRYARAGGPFGASDLRLSMRIAGRRAVVHPAAGSAPGNLGGWTRALDNEAAPVPLHDGILSRGGWYVVDDTQTVLLPTGSSTFAQRPVHSGAYEDWYLFAYGHDYTGGLADLRALTGPAPLLPRTAFGAWFSRYYPYSESDYHALLGQFRAHDVPLDTLSVDTDFKHEDNAAGAAAAAIVAGAPGLPYGWNGWEWDTALFGDPQRFIDWAHGQGLSLAINIHPSIDTNDPRYHATVAAAGPLSRDKGGCQLLQADPIGNCMTFDWTSRRQLDAYFALHAPFAQQGIDIFWLDWCCEGVQPDVPGLTNDTWINSRYAAEQRARGLRWPAFSRIGASYQPDGVDGDRGAGDGGDGALAEHRYTIQFTGDTCATWPMLGFEAQLSASEGNIGFPYISDDIGSYNGDPGNAKCGSADLLGPLATASRHLPDDLYARWVQFGAFQPLDRLHSNHGDRLPWQYGATADASASAFLRLREALGPYTYTLARAAYDRGVPLTRGLYLSWPEQAGAYAHPAEYTFGPDLVVAPVTSPGDPAPVTIWVPPGSWVDMFTGKRFRGPATVTLSVPLSRMPVLVRAGAVVPTQPDAAHTRPGPNPRLILTAYPGARGFTLYDDAGLGFGYERHQYARTAIRQRRSSATRSLRIAAARGRFPGALRSRTWKIRFLGISRPRRVTVRIAGRAPRVLRPGARGWSYDNAGRTLTVSRVTAPTRRVLTVTVRTSG